MRDLAVRSQVLNYQLSHLAYYYYCEMLSNRKMCIQSPARFELFAVIPSRFPEVGDHYSATTAARTLLRVGVSVGVSVVGDGAGDE